MEESLYLYESIGQVADRMILEAAEDLGLGRRRARAGRRLWRTILIAAAIAALMGVTAYAAGLLGLTERIYPVQESERVIVVPNGIKGSSTYEGTGAWWTWVYEHRNDPEGDLSGLDEQTRRTCFLYHAQSPEAAEELYRIAGAYGLRLYSDSVHALDGERLRALTGIGPFLREGEAELRGGYVFPDGSFSSEGQLRMEGLELYFDLRRFSTGAIYPYGGAMRLPDYSEEELVTALGQTVDLVDWRGERCAIWYLSQDGSCFISLDLYSLPGTETLQAAGYADPAELARAVADQIDFEALCEKNAEAARLLEPPRDASENADALARLEDFYHSDMFTAARDFQSFFTRTFYGSCFTGVHGQAGYEDIDRELERLAAQYGLRYATERHSADGTVYYDNGARYRREEAPADESLRLAITHYIPKDALYTRMIHYADFADYERVWAYTTAEGQQILCATDGPEKLSGSYLLYETEAAWVLVQVGHRDPTVMEQAAEAMDWTAFD